jgi:CcmD family protein
VKDSKMLLALVMSVPLVIWLGIFAYLSMIDRSLRRLEQDEKGQDEL